MQSHQQQTVVTTGVPVQPQQAYAVRTPGPFNARQATVIGILLIVIGCLSILFNAIELAVGTGMWNYEYYTARRSSSLTFRDNTLSHTSLGVAGHGFWCGAVVSIGIHLVVYTLSVLGVLSGLEKTRLLEKVFRLLTYTFRLAARSMTLDDLELL